MIQETNKTNPPFLPNTFFSRDTLTVARELLGCEIIRKINKRTLRCRIVETEAYLEKNDPAAHCARGPTPRSKIMFGAPGVIYVYFIYGHYFMLNFVTEKFGTAGAVLIRAVEPLEGFDDTVATNGPAKLVMALGIDKTLNGKTLALPHLAVAQGPRVKNIITTTRIGISRAQELPYRFYIEGNRFVSKKD